MFDELSTYDVQSPNPNLQRSIFKFLRIYFKMSFL